MDGGLVLRVERRVERSDEPGYWYTAVVVSPEGDYAARVYGARLGAVDLLAPDGSPLRLCPIRRGLTRGGHRLLGAGADVYFRSGRGRVLRMEVAGHVTECRPRPGGFEVVASGRERGSVTAEPRRGPAVDCLDAHGLRLAPARDWVLTVEPGDVPTAAWAGLMVVLDDRRPTSALGARGPSSPSTR